jgi:integrase
MPRQKLSEALKKTRYEKAKKRAARLNKQLPKPYCYAYATQWGKVYIYYHPERGVRIRLHSDYPSVAFQAELLAAQKGEPLQITQPRRRRHVPSPLPNAVWPEGTLGWLVEHRYMKEDESWEGYADQARRRRDLQACLRTRINPQAMDQEVFGNVPLESIGANTVRTLMTIKLEKREIDDTMERKMRVVTNNAEAANSRRKWLSGVFKFAVARGSLQHNFTKDVPKAKNDKLSPEQPDGWPTWPKPLIAAYREVHRPGTLARLVMELAFGLTARKSDISRLGRHLIQKDRQGRDTLVYWQHKGRNHAPVKVYQPIFPELQEQLDAAREAGLLGDMLFLVQSQRPTAQEKGYSEDTLANYMQDWVRAAMKHAGIDPPPGAKGYSLHGLRKAGICHLIERGIPDRWIMAISGHHDPRMIDLYGREMERAWNAEGAFDIYLGKHPLRTRNFDEEHFESEFKLA